MPPTPASSRSATGRMNRIRRWLLVGTVVPFGLLMAAATFEGFWDADDTRRTVAIVILIVGSIVVPLSMAFVARGILREAAALDLERAEMHQLYGQARRAALVDGLTGLGNHRAFQDELAFQLEEAQWQGTPLALLVFDVDGLKAVNDGNGHGAGDRLLAAVGQITAAILRRGDRAFRVGGDEFAVILPNSDVAIGLEVGRRMLTSALRGGDPSAPIEPFSLSIGVSAYPGPEHRHPRAVPARRRGPVLVQASRSDRRRRLRPQPPRRHRDRTADSGTGRRRRGRPRQPLAPSGLPADLLDGDRAPGRLRGSRPAHGRRAVPRRGVPLRGGRAGEPDCRA